VAASIGAGQNRTGGVCLCLGLQERNFVSYFNSDFWGLY